MMGALQYGEIERHVETVVRFWVSNAPPVTKPHATTITFHPEKITVIYKDGIAGVVHVEGKRILKGDKLGHYADQRFYHFELGVGRTAVPEWLWPFFAPLEARP